MSEKSCLTLRVAISVRCRELQERQDRHGYTKKLYDVIIMMYISVNLNFFEQNFQSSFVLSSPKKTRLQVPNGHDSLEHLRMIVEACEAEAQN